MGSLQSMGEAHRKQVANLEVLRQESSD